MAVTKTGERGVAEISITRLFAVPKEFVWKVWTEPALIRRWWGPAGFSAPFATIDFHAGGTYLYAMRSPEGKDFWSTGTFREIAPGQRIIATDSFCDETGKIVPASAYGMAGDWPDSLLVTVTFAEENGMTRLGIHHTGFPPGPHAVLARAGWLQSLDKLARVLAEEQAKPGRTHLVAEPDVPSMTVARVFTAPRDRVFAALTDPAFIAKWWAPHQLETIVETFEPRAGGSWRFVNRDASGNLFGFHGVYHEVSPARIVNTFEYEGMPGHVILQIATLEDLGDRTRLLWTSVFESVGDRDGMLSVSLATGGLEPMDQLAGLVES